MSWELPKCGLWHPYKGAESLSELFPSASPWAACVLLRRWRARRLGGDALALPGVSSKNCHLRFRLRPQISQTASAASRISHQK